MNPLSDLERLVAAIEHQGANIAPTYQEYMPIAFATANDCGEAGRTFFHRICRLSEASSGIMAGLNAARYLFGKEPLVLPNTTVTGALARYISDETVTNFQPMGANFGMLPPLPEKIRDKSERYTAIAERGMRDLEEYLKSLGL